MVGSNVGLPMWDFHQHLLLVLHLYKIQGKGYNAKHWITCYLHDKTILAKLTKNLVMRKHGQSLLQLTRKAFGSKFNS